MSTIYALLFRDGEHFEPEQDPDGIVVDDNIETVDIAKQLNGGGIRFYNLAFKLLKEDIKVYAIDNTQQGIYTIKDLLNEKEVY